MMSTTKKSPEGCYSKKLKKRNDAAHNFTEGKGSLQLTKKKWLFDGVEEAEQRMLGLIMWKPERVKQASKILAPSSFRYEKHQLIFRAMLDLEEQGKPINVVTLWDVLRDRGQLDSVGRSMYLTYLTQITFWEVR